MFDFDPALLPTSKSPLSLRATRHTVKEKMCVCVCVCCTVALVLRVKVGVVQLFQVVGIKNLIFLIIFVKLNEKCFFENATENHSLRFTEFIDHFCIYTMH